MRGSTCRPDRHLEMQTPIKFEFLADRPAAAAAIAQWYFDEWGHLRPGTTVGRVLGKLQGSLNRDRIPLILLAVAGDEIVGVAELKYREMDCFPEKEHWLGGVFVAAEYRGKGIAAKLIGKIVELAKPLGVRTLHLQTQRWDGGLYARLGWKPVQRLRYKGLDVLVMALEIE